MSPSRTSHMLGPQWLKAVAEALGYTQEELTSIPAQA
jgi:hypothetical protein